MDQSGPRYPALKSPIIQRPDLQLPRQRIIYGALTAAFWAFWVYLWVPVLALLAWSLGVQQAYKYMIVFGGYHDVINLFALYALIITLMGGTLVAWAIYNIVRFRGIENRIASAPITPREIARDFGVEQLDVERWQTERYLSVTHDLEGRIARVEYRAR